MALDHWNGLQNFCGIRPFQGLQNFCSIRSFKGLQNFFVIRSLKWAAEFLWHWITERGCRISVALEHSKGLQNFCGIGSLKGAAEFQWHWITESLWHQIISKVSEFMRHPSIRSWDTTKTIIIKVIILFFFGHAPHCWKKISGFRWCQNGVRENSLFKTIFEKLPTKTIDLC